MTLNEGLIRQNFITKILLKDEQNELDKTLKAKVMSMRIALTKIRTQFDQDCQEAIKHLKPENFDKLASIEVKSKEQEEEFKKLIDKLNEDYNAFLIEKGKEEIAFDKVFTQEEYEQIVDVNAGNDIEINGNTMAAPDFLEVIYSLFVETI